MSAKIKTVRFILYVLMPNGMDSGRSKNLQGLVRDNMNELQSKLFDMLVWFHQICHKNEIRYFAIGGTLLGAVRHKGFIPWDDDIDLGIPRPDYERLKNLLQDRVYENKYFLEQPLVNKDFVYPHCKLIDVTTTLVENTRYKTKRGINIDIFPLDGIGDNEEESVRRFKKADRKIKYMSAKVCAINGQKSFLRNAAIIVGRCIPEWPFGWRRTVKRLDDFCRVRDYDKCKFIGNMLGNWHMKEIAEREWFGDGSIYEFEGIEIIGPINADAYLRHIYGDYMQLPPKEKRISHHDYLFLDLNSPYSDNYIKGEK